MKYDAEIEIVLKRHAAEIAKEAGEWDDIDCEFEVHVERVVNKGLRNAMKDVAKLVRDATLRFYRAKKKKEPIPQDLRDMPLFREAVAKHDESVRVKHSKPPKGAPPVVKA